MAWSKQSKAPTKEGHRLDHATKIEASLPDSVDVISTEIEVSQRWALPQHCCKTLCPCNAEFILAEIEVRRHWVLAQVGLTSSPASLSASFPLILQRFLKSYGKGPDILSVLMRLSSLSVA